jgi:predicted nucleic acid-binding protein
MRVLVDTCIWSNVFRYKNPVLSDKDLLMNLVEDDRASLIGPIRQEFLSGIKEQAKFLAMKNALRSFADLPLKTEIFELAADMFNNCRRRGVSASTVDMMICAASKYYNLSIWSDDPDFGYYKTCIDITLYSRT